MDEKGGIAGFEVTATYRLGGAMRQQAWIWYDQHRFEEVRSEALRAADVHERLGAVKEAEGCRNLLWKIGKGLDIPAASGKS